MWRQTASAATRKMGLARFFSIMTMSSHRHSRCTENTPRHSVVGVILTLRCRQTKVSRGTNHFLMPAPDAILTPTAAPLIDTLRKRRGQSYPWRRKLTRRRPPTARAAMNAIRSVTGCQSSSRMCLLVSS